MPINMYILNFTQTGKFLNTVTRWPSNPGCLFLECLMGNCQYVQLQVSFVEDFLPFL